MENYIKVEKIGEGNYLSVYYCKTSIVYIFVVINSFYKSWLSVKNPLFSKCFSPLTKFTDF